MSDLVGSPSSATGAMHEPTVENGRRRRLGPVAGLLFLSACAQPAATLPEPTAIEQRLQNLEWRLETLERFVTNLPSPPQRSRVEIERSIQSLQAKRAALLERYTSAHPAVREVDLSLRLLTLQLQMLDQAQSTTK